MTLLLISPDYASHYLPMSAVAAHAAADGAEVVVATGGGLRAAVERDGYRWIELTMSAGSNGGRRAVRQPGDDLTPFLTATKHGMVTTLRQQADARRHDLLWRPERVAADTLDVVENVRPEAVLIDHLCVAARLGLYAGHVPATSFVPGHPTQLPVGGEVYGAPVAWPAWVRPDAAELDALEKVCVDVRDELADVGNRVIRTIDRTRAPVADVFGAHGATVLYNSPSALRDPGRRGPPTPHHFLGSCVRPVGPVDEHVRSWLADGEPFVYVSLGTFLSARRDVLGRIVATLAATGRRVALATGSTDVGDLGPLPDGWLVDSFLPQIALIGRADVVVCHGGNNTVTEALAAGRPLLVLPFSTDQFAIAADVERAGVGVSADPNRSSTDELAGALVALDDPTVRAAAGRAAAAMAADGGPRRAVAVLRGRLPRGADVSGG